MKNLIYIFLAVGFLVSVHSCKRIGDEDGNLLNEMGQNDNLLGADRYLHQEVTSADTLAFYQYEARKLVRVLGNNTITKISYSGELINRIEFNGVVDGDSIAYIQLFNYSVTDYTKLANITETRSVFDDINNQTAPLVAQNTKSIYNITFDGNTRLEKVVKQTGVDIPLTTFMFSDYQTTEYTYDAVGNVTKAQMEFGAVNGGTLQPPHTELAYTYGEYDDGRSPYSLLPFGYLLHRSFDNPFDNYRFSPNNPKRIVLSGNLLPVPVPYSTLYTYDHLKYAKTGWGVYYEYRTF